MGASGWRYTVPFQPDLQAALDALRDATFRRGDYAWFWERPWVAPGEERPRPATLAELVADELVETEGTHSIIDCPRVVEGPPGTTEGWRSPAYFGSVVPVTVAELALAVGTDRPTGAQLGLLEERVACARWVGRCATLHTEAGVPEQLAFWGYSGD